MQCVSSEEGGTKGSVHGMCTPGFWNRVAGPLKCGTTATLEVSHLAVVEFLYPFSSLKSEGGGAAAMARGYLPLARKKAVHQNWN